MTLARVPGGPALLLVGLLSVSHVAKAQSCNGSPNASSFAYEFGSMFLANSQGGQVSFVGGGKALDLSAGIISSDEFDVTGQKGSIRFSVIFGKRGQGLRVCPGIGLGALHQALDVEPGVTVDQYTAGARASLGLGYQLPAYAGIELSPFLLGQYEYA